MKKRYLYGTIILGLLLYASPAAARILIQASPEVDGHDHGSAAHVHTEDSHSEAEDARGTETATNEHDHDHGEVPATDSPDQAVSTPAYYEPVRIRPQTFYQPAKSFNYSTRNNIFGGRINTAPIFKVYTYRREPVYTYGKTYVPTNYRRSYEPDSTTWRQDSSLIKPYVYTRGEAFQYRRTYVPDTYYRTYQ